MAVEINWFKVLIYFGILIILHVISFFIINKSSSKVIRKYDTTFKIFISGSLISFWMAYGIIRLAEFNPLVKPSVK